MKTQTIWLIAVLVFAVSLSYVIFMSTVTKQTNRSSFLPAGKRIPVIVDLSQKYVQHKFFRIQSFLIIQITRLQIIEILSSVFR